jgi:hypothetical protein
MSNKRYLEFDSTYRNRNEFPNPTRFNVSISQSGTRDAVHALDPVSNSAPIKTWSPDDLVLTTGVVATPATQPLNTTSSFTVSFQTTQNASKLNNYYSGYPISVNIPGISEFVRIVTWTYLSTDPGSEDFFRVSVSPALSAIPDGSVTFTPASSVSDLPNGNMFVPNGLLADHFYVGLFLYNEDISISSSGTQNNYRRIISYDRSSKLLGFDLNNGSVDPAVPIGDTWNTSHKYTIRKSVPQYVGNLPASLLIPAPPPLLLPYQGPNTKTTFAVPSNIIVSIGDFIRFTTGNLAGKSYRVVKYTGNGRSEDLTANPPINYIPPNIVAVSPVLDTIPPDTGGWAFEVLQFTRDNVVPFSYSGSLVSQQEMVCYEIELLNLIIPNRILSSGGYTYFYPYLYVELQNISSSSAGTKSVIYSNNPNSHRMLFRAAIDDTANPLVTPFLKIDGDGMVQTVKFKPNDNLSFGVYLPNGDILETIQDDNFSPHAPNPLIQISAIFSIKRL